MTKAEKEYRLIQVNIGTKIKKYINISCLVLLLAPFLFDFFDPIKYLAVYNIVVIIVDGIFILRYRGLLVGGYDDKVVPKDSPIRSENIDMESSFLKYCIIFLFDMAVITKYNFENALSWFLLIAVFGAIVFVYLLWAKLFKADGIIVILCEILFIAFFSGMISFWGVYLTGSHSQEEVSVVDRDTYVTSGKSRRRVYEVTIERKNKHKEEMEVSKHLYDRAEYMKDGYFIDVIEAAGGQRMYRLFYGID
ncbi:MAG: hypothetical protein K5851_00405 [Lachnospiraceae bacterium]|nr:hypothetical protein [Lachnospiraceae bacterium]